MPERYSLSFDVDDVHVKLSSVGRMKYLHDDVGHEGERPYSVYLTVSLAQARDKADCPLLARTRRAAMSAMSSPLSRAKRK